MPYKIIEACIGCSLCSKHCPVNAINGSLKEKHTINEKRCVECGVCGNVCPRGAIADAHGNIPIKIPKTNWRKPVIDKELCSACSMCVDICSFDCIKISQPLFKGDVKVYAVLENKDKCVGCKMCADICPLKAIIMKEASK